MLGNSGSGKTCYMVSMYKMMSTGIGLDGFTLSAEDPDDNTRFSELWQALTDSQGQDRWPPPTTEETLTYGFNFNYAFKPVLGFDWFDYRGDALIDYGNSPDVSELRQRLLATSCILLCISGEHFKNKLKVSAYDKIGVGAINQLIAHSQPNNRQNFPPSVVIVITKYDLCSHRKKQDIIKEIKEVFSTFFAPGTKWLVMICPVSLGEELAQDIDTGEIDPVNIHLPVVFSMLAELVKQSQQLYIEKSSNYQQLQSMTQNMIRRYLEKNNIAKNQGEMVFINNRIAEITNQILLLCRQLNNNNRRKNDSAQIFFDGREVRVHEFFQ